MYIYEQKYICILKRQKTDVVKQVGVCACLCVCVLDSASTCTRVLFVCCSHMHMRMPVGVHNPIKLARAIVAYTSCSTLALSRRSSGLSKTPASLSSFRSLRGPKNEPIAARKTNHHIHFRQLQCLSFGTFPTLTTNLRHYSQGPKTGSDIPPLPAVAQLNTNYNTTTRPDC